jgi:hypothetical protein
MNSVEVGPVLKTAEHRVEEGLGKFRLLVVDQQFDVVKLGAPPNRIVDAADGELPAQALQGFHDACVIERQAIPDRLLHAVPVGGVEALLGAGGAGAKQPIVPVEALDQFGGDAAGGGFQGIGFFLGHVVRAHANSWRGEIS